MYCFSLTSSSWGLHEYKSQISSLFRVFSSIYNQSSFLYFIMPNAWHSFVIWKMHAYIGGPKDDLSTGMLKERKPSWHLANISPACLCLKCSHQYVQDTAGTEMLTLCVFLTVGKVLFYMQYTSWYHHKRHANITIYMIFWYHHIRYANTTRCMCWYHIYDMLPQNVILFGETKLQLCVFLTACNVLFIMDEEEVKMRTLDCQWTSLLISWW